MVSQTHSLEVDLRGLRLKLTLIEVLSVSAAAASAPLLIGAVPHALAGTLPASSLLLMTLAIMLGALGWANRNAVDGILRHRRAWLQLAAGLLVAAVAGSTILFGDDAYVYAVTAGLVALLSVAAAALSLVVARWDVPGLQISLAQVGSRLRVARTGRRPFAPQRPVVGTIAIVVAAYLLAVAMASSTVGGDVGAASRHTLIALGLLAVALPMFEPRGEVVLGKDRRNPILLLRSFSEDEHANFLIWQNPGWLGSPIEAKLGHHFSRFGPFVALGQEAQVAGVRGAARVILSDAEWQPQIVSWIDQAQCILMFAGTTSWLSWELEKVIEARAVPRLIISFPPIDPLVDNDEARIASVRAAFEGTPWAAGLSQPSPDAAAIALAFLDHGIVARLCSRSSGRNVHQLAVLLGHYLQLEAAGASAIAAGIGAEPKHDAKVNVMSD